MKRTFTHGMTIAFLLLFNALILNAQVFTWDKSELTTAWADASAASTIKTSSGITLQQIGTQGVVTSYIQVGNSNASMVLNSTSNDALTITSATDPISSIKITYGANGSTNTTNPYVGFNATPTAMGSATAVTSSCEMSTGVTGTAGVQVTYTPPTGTKFAILVRNKACGSVAANSGTFRIMRIEVYTVPSTPGITAFNVAGVNATINETAKTITAELPYGSSLTGITPTVTISGTATSYSPTGAQDFSAGAVNYTATDGTNNAVYAVTLTVAATIASPVITSPANKNQWVKAGSAITDMAYTFQNAIGATVTGLPTGLNGTYLNGTFTISGTVDAAVTPGAFDYIVKATPLLGYTGSDITATGTIAVKDLTAANILYLASDATTPANDLFLAQLLSKSNYFVTKRTAQAAFAGNYDAYNLIVLHESLTGGDAATAGHELNLMKTVDKPILNTKSYFYSVGTTPRWGWGSPTNGNSGKGMNVVQPSHPIFSGITLSDSLYIYNTLTAKNIQPVTAVTIGGYQLAKVAGGIAIHELPASIRLGAGKTSKYLMISLLSTKFNDLSADGLKLLDNAVQYLLTGTQFDAPSLAISSFNVNSVEASIDNTANTIKAILPSGTDVTALQPTIVLNGVGTAVSPASGVATNFSTSVTTPINYTVTDGINSKVYATSITVEPSGLIMHTIDGVYFDGQTIHNNANVELQVVDALGRIIVSSNKNINMNHYTKGIYVVKSNIASFKIAIIR